MARRKIDVLRDEIVAAACSWSEAADEPFESGAAVMCRLVASRNLREAVREYQAYLRPIIDSPGEYVEGSPETSRNAALAITPKTGSHRRRIVEEVRSAMHYGAFGLSDSELEHRLKLRHETLSSARNHLMNGHWLIDSGWKKTSPAGQPVILWKLTDAALAALNQEAMQ